MKLGSLRRRWLNEEEMSRYRHVVTTIDRCREHLIGIFGTSPSCYILDNMYSDLLLAVDQSSSIPYKTRIPQAVYKILQQVNNILSDTHDLIAYDQVNESTKDQLLQICNQVLKSVDYKRIFDAKMETEFMQDSTYLYISDQIESLDKVVRDIWKDNVNFGSTNTENNSASAEELRTQLNNLTSKIGKWFDEKPGRRPQFGEQVFQYVEGFDEAHKQNDLVGMRENLNVLRSAFDEIKRDEAGFQTGLFNRTFEITNELKEDKEVWKAAPAKRDEFYSRYKSMMADFDQNKVKFERLFGDLDFLLGDIIRFQNSVKKSAANNPASNGNPAGGKPDPIDSPTNNDRINEIRRKLHKYSLLYPLEHKNHSSKYKSFDDYKTEIESAVEKSDLQRAEKLITSLKNDYDRMMISTALDTYRMARNNATLTYNVYVQEVNNRKAIGSDFPEPFKSDLKRAAEELKKVLTDTKYLLDQPKFVELNTAIDKIHAANDKLHNLCLAVYGMKANPTGGTTKNNALVNKFSKIDSTLKYTDDYTMQNDITDYNKTRDSRDAEAVVGRVKEYTDLSKKSGLGKLWAYAKYAVNRGRDFVAGLLDKLNTWMKKIQQEIYEKGTTGFLTMIKKNIAKVVDFLTRKLHNLIQKHRGNISDYVYYKKNGKVYMAGNEKLSESYKVGFLNEDNFEKIDTGIGYLDSYDLGKRVDYVIENMILMGE